MTASSFGASFSPGLSPGLTATLAEPAPRPLPLPVEGRPRRSAWRPRSATPLIVAVGLVLGAGLLAPEQPRDQEAICHRHNGVAACRVW